MLTRRGLLRGLFATPLILRPPSMGRLVPVSRLIQLDPQDLFGSIAEAMLVQVQMAGAYGSAAVRIEGSADGIRFVPISYEQMYRRV